jgi:REP element-mobilizing transposase RayT
MPLAFDRHWLLTWTTYGTWLPGDVRGFVSPISREAEGGKWARENRPGVAYDRDMPDRLKQSRQLLKGPPVFLRLPQAELLLGQFQETARHRGWGLLAAAVMRAHVHVVVGVPGDPEPDAMLRDFKAYGSRVLNRQFSRPESGTWWTEGGSKRVKRAEAAVVAAVRYVARQEKALVVWVDAGWEWVLGERGGKR